MNEESGWGVNDNIRSPLRALELGAGEGVGSATGVGLEIKERGRRDKFAGRCLAGVVFLFVSGIALKSSDVPGRLKSWDCKGKFGLMLSLDAELIGETSSSSSSSSRSV